MKTTAERLSEVYCRPTVEQGIRMLNYNEWTDEARSDLKKRISCEPFVVFLNGNRFAFRFGKSISDAIEGKNEIPQSHFIDLIEDKIVEWRLVEDGFENTEYGYRLNLILVVHPDPSTGLQVEIDNDMPVTISTNCKTYTDLLTLIRLL